MNASMVYFMVYVRSIKIDHARYGITAMAAHLHHRAPRATGTPRTSHSVVVSIIGELRGSAIRGQSPLRARSGNNCIFAQPEENHVQIACTARSPGTLACQRELYSHKEQFA